MIKQLKPAAALLAGLLFLAGCGRTATDAEENSDEIIEPNLLYGIPADNYRLEQQIIDRGETLGQILNRYGVSAAQIDQLDKASKDVFPLRNIRAGRSYTAFIHEDSLNAPPSGLSGVRTEHLPVCRFQPGRRLDQCHQRRKRV